MCSSTTIRPSLVASPAFSPRPARGLTPAAIRTRSASLSIDSTAVPSWSVTPSASSQAWMRSPTSSPSRVACGDGSSLTSVTSRPRMASDAAASQPMKPEPITPRRRWPSPPGRAGRGRWPGCAAAAPTPRSRPGPAAGRLGAGGEHARVVVQRLAVAQQDRPRVGVQGLRFGAEPDLDLVLGVPARRTRSGRSSSEASPRRNSFESGGRLYGTVSSGVRSVTVAVAPGLAVAAGGRERRRPAAHDQEPHTVKRSRLYSGVGAAVVGVAEAGCAGARGPRRRVSG